MTRRFEYQLDLKEVKINIRNTDEIMWRIPSPDDKQILADHMLDAYRNTIDYDGETIDDAMNEVESYFSGRTGPAWLESSWLAFEEKQLVCAALVSFWNDRKVPLFAYVMTAAAAKGKHIAVAAVSRSLESLIEQGHAEVRAVITDGNIPSEKVFTKLGFVRLTSI